MRIPSGVNAGFEDQEVPDRASLRHHGRHPPRPNTEASTTTRRHHRHRTPQHDRRRTRTSDRAPDDTDTRHRAGVPPDHGRVWCDRGWTWCPTHAVLSLRRPTLLRQRGAAERRGRGPSAVRAALERGVVESEALTVARGTAGGDVDPRSTEAARHRWRCADSRLEHIGAKHARRPLPNEHARLGQTSGGAPLRPRRRPPPRTSGFAAAEGC